MYRLVARFRFRVLAAAALVALAGGPAAAQDGLLRTLLGAHKDAFWFSVVEGRVALRWNQVPYVNTSSGSWLGTESFFFRNENGQPKLTYDGTNGAATLKIEAVGAGGDLHVSRTPRGMSKQPALDFRQAPGEPIVLKVGTGPEQRVFRADDLWRLLIEEPKECRERLLPLLDPLRPGKKLADAVTEVEAKLVETAGKQTDAQQAHWAALVRQLGDESFARREAADLELRAGGTSALAYLHGLDFTRLDAEQQFRIRRMLETAAAQTADDSPEQAAAALVGDPAVWLALVGRPERATRQTAAKQLASLLGGPIDLDPAADPDTQKDKREQLRRRIEGK